MRLFLFLLAGALLSGCNDVTEPMPSIAGTYLYRATGPLGGTRSGTVTLYDDDRRSASFSGDFEYREQSGQLVRGKLNGAFINDTRIWFSFLDERGVYHEADFILGFGSGDIFLQGPNDYARSGWTFTLNRAR